jgi:lysozyme
MSAPGNSDTPGRRALAAKIGASAAVLAVALITTFEGYSARVSKDPIGRLQVCYGHDDQKMKLGTAYTRAECEAILDVDLLEHAEVLDCVKYPARDKLPEGVKAALVSFAYNVGTPKSCGSSFVRRLSAGEGRAACAELSKWVYAGGKDCRDRANNCIGIVNRRAAERRICEGMT